jgi:NodT family efflux transporter outer membrane factor (OMF) lipoprotein
MLVIHLTALAAWMPLTGCVVGPDFKKPEAPQVSGYTATQPTTTSSTPEVAGGGEAQRFVPGQDIPGQWWQLFHSKSLDFLVERSLQANPNLKAAQAALLEAREFVLAQNGADYPSVSLGFSAARQQTSQSIAPVPNENDFTFNLFTPDVSVSYMPDVFGLNRRTVESLEAQAQQSRYALAATHIALSANVVVTAIQEASLREQIAATQQLIAINTDELQILRNQFSKGYAGRLDVAAQESQLAQVVATLPPLLQQLAQQRDSLAVLSGCFPSEGPTEEFELANLQLPRELPLSLPSQLVEQRPDVLQAEENLHSASAQIGIAVANRLPNFTLSADAGTMALSFGQMFAGDNAFWTLAGSVSEPIFDGGALLHKERAARAAYVQAEEQYRSTVLTAFQNVADTLTALEHDADALNAAAAAENAARITLDLTRQQLQTGYTNYLSLLSAEQTYQQAVIALVQARANRYADTTALFLALGGGWWNRADVPKR